MKYKLSLAGGTFDHFHDGHAAFLRTILSESNHVLLGITSDSYVRKYKANPGNVQTYSERKQSVQQFFKREHSLQRLTIAPIDSALYPEAWEALPIEVIFVTQDTINGAKQINEDRQKKNLNPITIVTVATLLNQQNTKISSSNIRDGQMDQSGKLYSQYLLAQDDLILPTSARKLLKAPWGTIITDEKILYRENPEQLISVGDVVSQTCNKLGLQQKLSIIDFTVQREKLYSTEQEIGFSGTELVLPANNPPGHITASLKMAVRKAFSLMNQTDRIIIKINGEEDLAVVPVLLAAPLGFVILYGQPNKGMVRLPVTLSNKQKALDMIKLFKLA